MTRLTLASPIPPAPAEGPCLALRPDMGRPVYTADTAEARDPAWWAAQGITCWASLRYLPLGTRSHHGSRPVWDGYVPDLMPASSAPLPDHVEVATPDGTARGTLERTADGLRVQVSRLQWAARVRDFARRVVEGVRDVA
jgi:hypothetical protein